MQKEPRLETMPFEIRDCTLISRMAGLDTALNLRELRERLLVCPVECLFHHFCETVIRPAFDDPEYRNDIAIWASRDLGDRVLAERLGVVNPYALGDFETLRATVLDLIDERLAELPNIPWVPKGHDFRFMQAVTVVFDTGHKLHSPADLRKKLPHMSLSSIYYHFVEARRRTPDGMDDFTAWLLNFGGQTRAVVEALDTIDFYFLTLPTLKRALVETVQQTIAEEPAHEPSA
ncbi:MAG: hypothetical protein JSU65_04265 [Candidatus Zixiibacteriota bacterium]|nr:MAG: hypothetical protein JSU65_04265 [candidate division Zixibacteria bacterium]